MADRGIAFALAPGGAVADPRTAPPLERQYTCPACGDFVFLKLGSRKPGGVRAPHFAHYVERDVVCNPETVEHEAAKRRLRTLLQQGLDELEVTLDCPGYTDKDGRHLRCPEMNPVAQRLAVPRFDLADIEVPYGPYRLDTALSRQGEVVLGLEVYHSHHPEHEKTAHLTTSGLLWVELNAQDVLTLPMPWPTLSGSVPVRQCGACVAREHEAREEHRRREEAERLRRQRGAEQAERQRLTQRAVPVAMHKGFVVTTSQARPGHTYRCLVCKGAVRLIIQQGQPKRFDHVDQKICPPHEVWTRAGMLSAYRALKLHPRDVQIVRRCSGLVNEELCKNYLKDPLPEFDTVEGCYPSLLLRKAGRPVLQVNFGRNPKHIAPMKLALKPGKLVHKPHAWKQPKDGRLCPQCSTGASASKQENLQASLQNGLSATAQERRREEVRSRLLSLHLEENHDELMAACLLLKDAGIDPHVLALVDCVLSPCLKCGETTINLLPPHNQDPPKALEPLLEFRGGATGAGGEVSRRTCCLHCRHPLPLRTFVMYSGTRLSGEWFVAFFRDRFR